MVKGATSMGTLEKLATRTSKLIAAVRNEDSGDQLDRQLADAQSALESAQRALVEATGAFDASGSDDDLEIDEAEKAVTLAQRRFARAQRLVAARAEQRERERLAGLREQESRLTAELTAERLRAAAEPLDAEYAEAALRLARVHERRQAHHDAVRDRRLALLRVRDALGQEQPERAYAAIARDALGYSEVCDALDAAAAGMPAESAAGKHLGMLVDALAPGRHKGFVRLTGAHAT
jgi:chromosome segregation ATPase